MGLQDHADIISSISDCQRDRVLFGGFDQLHDLETQERVTSLLQTITADSCKQSITTACGLCVPFNTEYFNTHKSKKNPAAVYLCFLERSHSTAEHSAAVAADF